MDDSTKKVISLDDFEMVRSIGSGAFSKVYLVKKKETNTYYAAKVLNTPIDEDSDGKQETLFIYREVKLVSSLNHPSILAFIGYSPTDFRSLPFPTLITEYAPNGTLREIIKLELSGLAPKGWDDTRKLINIYGIAVGLQYLHENEVIHRDLKPENILMDEYLFPKIADFGLSKLTNSINQSVNIQSQMGYKGTPLYMSPEILIEEEYSKEGDVYAFAIMTYEILTGKTPFMGLSLGQLIKKVAINAERPELTSDISPPYQELLQNCWSQNQSERPKFEDIVEALKTNQDFIADTIDESEYYNYIDYIEEHKSSFDINSSIHYKDLMKKKGKKTKIEQVSINDDTPQKVLETTDEIEQEDKQQKKTILETDSKDRDSFINQDLKSMTTVNIDLKELEEEYLSNAELNEAEITKRFNKINSSYKIYNPTIGSLNYDVFNNGTIVLDIGSCTTKIGFHYDSLPSVIPSVISNKCDIESEHWEMDQYDFYIGNEAIKNNKSLYKTEQIVKNGIVDWSNLEKFLEQCFFKYMQYDPEDHPIIVVLPNRSNIEYQSNISEILFETFNSPFLALRYPPMLAMASSWSAHSKSLTGCTVHFGENSTDVDILDEGYQIYDASQSIPIGGNTLTRFIVDALKDREKTIPSKDLFQTAINIKERYCRIGRYLSPTFKMFDSKRDQFIVNYTGVSTETGKQFTCEVGYERFLTPYLYIKPEISNNNNVVYSLPELIFSAIHKAPYFDRIKMYKNIVFYGGSSKIKGLASVIQNELQELVDQEAKQMAKKFSALAYRYIEPALNKVNVVEFKRQHIAEWYGASMYASTYGFSDLCISRYAYFEKNCDIRAFF
ncbi:Actin- protein 3 [Tritrichomonas musculus]|uniref:Actin- protein 3 n=1 Tax=Tritrichomonas musculus TaxID=1915356 RepID=A0ABR2K6B2_9EUKA